MTEQTPFSKIFLQHSQKLYREELRLNAAGEQFHQKIWMVQAKEMIPLKYLYAKRAARIALPGPEALGVWDKLVMLSPKNRQREFKRLL
jgi:hypothetical protein